MLFNSYSFLVVFPVVVLIHFLLPKKVQYLWLLATSYYFYMNWDARYVLLLLFSTAVTYASGLIMEQAQTDKGRKMAVAISFVLNIGVLFFFKYFNFAIDSVNLVLSQIHLSVPKPDFQLLLPVGISFYTFQAILWMYIEKKLQPRETFLNMHCLFPFFRSLWQDRLNDPKIY